MEADKILYLTLRLCSCALPPLSCQRNCLLKKRRRRRKGSKKKIRSLVFVICFISSRWLPLFTAVIDNRGKKTRRVRLSGVCVWGERVNAPVRHLRAVDLVLRRKI